MSGKFILVHFTFVISLINIVESVRKKLGRVAGLEGKIKGGYI